ncbi:putative NADPH-dependent FMN reductase [Nitrospina gracilis 3/211]|uniref:Putative NADPH-dependent FMN reductase n=1 Tax=Nitrospina gracilis (strain 3/211) TaxID=1266370 RepID=M1ZE16_NITG3|nr:MULTISPECIES: NAD(P)H-dependent oxidoreductase [Nitrospina]MCF8724584.1 NAD(P)H-dependent FMN reductase [Nitrospina sp. Nb-3]CCQ91762.1 putative NADPH-dependent FMN reductase [Nitrospina gracilis 3/211]
MVKIILIQGSLNPDSHTAKLLAATARELDKRGVGNETIDLRDLEMQFCDSRPLREYNESTQTVHKKLADAQGFVFGMPVYCYSVSGPLKNFIDIHSSAMEKKWAGIVAQAGGKSSYMSLGDLAQILAFESHVTTVQPHVYTTYADYDGDELTSEKARAKIQEMLDKLVACLHAAKEENA